jgi:nucleoid-associated protein EbfC
MIKGMMDMMSMFKQAQELQGKMESAQKEAAETLVHASSGGGLVQATGNAKGTLISLKIDPSLLNVDEANVVEDLVIAAVNDLKTRGERALQEKMSEVTQGMGLPDMSKLFGG